MIKRLWTKIKSFFSDQEVEVPDVVEAAERTHIHPFVPTWDEFAPEPTKPEVREWTGVVTRTFKTSASKWHREMDMLVSHARRVIAKRERERRLTYTKSKTQRKNARKWSRKQRAR